MSDSYNWISSRSRFSHGLSVPKAEPKVDEEVSHIVGKKIYANDMRLIKLVTQFKNKIDPDSDTPLELMKNPHFIQALKDTLSK